MNVYYLHMYISMHAFVKKKKQTTKKQIFPVFFFVTLDEMVVVCVVL